MINNFARFAKYFFGATYFQSMIIIKINWLKLEKSDRWRAPNEINCHRIIQLWHD